MLIISNRDNPPKAGQSDIAFWIDLINEEDGDNALTLTPREDVAGTDREEDDGDREEDDDNA